MDQKFKITNILRAFFYPCRILLPKEETSGDQCGNPLYYCLLPYCCSLYLPSVDLLQCEDKWYHGWYSSAPYAEQWTWWISKHRLIAYLHGTTLLLSLTSSTTSIMNRTCLILQPQVIHQSVYIICVQLKNDTTDMDRCLYTTCYLSLYVYSNFFACISRSIFDFGLKNTQYARELQVITLNLATLQKLNEQGDVSRFEVELVGAGPARHRV